MVVKQRKWSFLLIAALSVLLIGLMASIALAQTATPEAGTEDNATQADSLSLRGLHHGLMSSGSSAHDEYLAEALGITLEQLQAARRTAMAAYLADAVTAGDITQEQADLALARHALRDIIDQKALLAEALGMTEEELQAALDDGQSLPDLMAAQVWMPTPCKPTYRLPTRRPLPAPWLTASLPRPRPTRFWPRIPTSVSSAATAAVVAATTVGAARGASRQRPTPIRTTTRRPIPISMRKAG